MAPAATRNVMRVILSPVKMQRPFTKWGIAMAAALGAIAPAAGLQGQRPESVIPVVDEAPTNAKDFDWVARHNRVIERVRRGNVDLVLIGDSITHMWGGVPADPEKGPGPVDLWKRYFAPRNTVNLGFGWDRTEHVLWRLQHGEIDNIRPKVAVVQIGTNNLWKHSPDDIALGIKTIVHTVRQKLPRTKILLIGIFPRDKDANTPNRVKAAQVNARIASLGHEKNVTYLEFGSLFLEPDGSVSSDVMPDYLHLSAKGFKIWAQAMEPTLSRLMGDRNRTADVEISGDAG